MTKKIITPDICTKKMGILLLSISFILLGFISTPSRAESRAGEPSNRQIQFLSNNCIQCHANPATNAPQMGNKNDWQESIKGGQQQMLFNTIEGMQGMPPLGYCSACSEQDFKVLIELMSGISFKREVEK